MSRVLATEQRARGSYLCDRCGELIAAGATYVRATLPPFAEPNESKHWWTLRYHGHQYENCPYRIGHRCGVGCEPRCIASNPVVTTPESAVATRTEASRG